MIFGSCVLLFWLFFDVAFDPKEMPVPCDFGEPCYSSLPSSGMIFRPTYIAKCVICSLVSNTLRAEALVLAVLRQAANIL